MCPTLIHSSHLNFLAERQHRVIKTNTTIGKRQASSWHLLSPTPSRGRPRGKAVGRGGRRAGRTAAPAAPQAHRPPQAPGETHDPRGGGCRGTPLSPGATKAGVAESCTPRRAQAAPGTGPKRPGRGWEGGRHPLPAETTPGFKPELGRGCPLTVARSKKKRKQKKPLKPRTVARSYPQRGTLPQPRPALQGVAGRLRPGLAARPRRQRRPRCSPAHPPLTSPTGRAPPSSCRPWRLLPPLTHRTGPVRGGRALREELPALGRRDAGPARFPAPSALSGRSARPALR